MLSIISFIIFINTLFSGIIDVEYRKYENYRAIFSEFMFLSIVSFYNILIVATVNSLKVSQSMVFHNDKSFVDFYIDSRRN